MSDGTVIGALVSITIAGASGIGWLIRRRDNQKDPIPKQSAAVALADQSVTMMAAVAAELRSDMQSVRAKLSEVEDELRATRLEVVSLKAAMATLDNTLAAAVRYIEQLMRFMRSKAGGPEPAVPDELRDLIDPTLWRQWGSDDAEVTT